MSAKTPNAYGLTPEALEAMRNGDTPSAPGPEQPVRDAKAAPADQAAEPNASEPSQQEQLRRGNPEVPIRQLRQQLAQQQALLQDPQQLAAYLRANGFDMVPLGATPVAATHATQGTPKPDAADPFEAFEPETANALRAVLKAHVKPLADKLALAEQRQQQAQHHANLLALEQAHPGLMENVRAFDIVVPEARGLDPLVKHLAIQGNRMTDPEQHAEIIRELLDQMDPAHAQALLAPLAKDQAVSMVADKLVGGKAQKHMPVTLAGALPARGNGAPKDISTISLDEWRAMPDAEREKYRNG